MMMVPDKTLENSIFTFTEATLISHMMTETAHEGLMKSIKNFFTKLIISFKEFINEIQLKIEYKIREKELTEKLRKIQTELKNDPSEGNVKIEITDFWNYEKVYRKLNSELESYAKKFAKIKYSAPWQIEDDIEIFNKIIEDYNEKMEEAANKTNKIEKIKIITFIRDELRGKSNIISSLNDNIRHFEEMKMLAESIEMKKDMLGVDVIPKHVGFIRKIANEVSKFVRKWVSKFVAMVVFKFS